jgi:hypothetical protein
MNSNIKKLTIVTNASSRKLVNRLFESLSSIIPPDQVITLCITKKMDTNVSHIKKDPKHTVAFDPATVSKNTIESYVTAINSQSSNPPTLVSIGMKAKGTKMLSGWDKLPDVLN